MDTGVLTLERTFQASPQKVFDFVTKKQNLLKWWGPIGCYVDENHLDFSKIGSYFFVMVAPNGGRAKVSGKVLAVNAPYMVEFDMSMPGDEQCLRMSVVKFEIAANEQGGTDFKLTQTGLTSEEITFNRSNGWMSTLTRLAALLEKN
ncbi:MAG: SRPBCC domain-containing protein [Rhizobiales bacterium]|nr:SRPBCC domain-containing protein [Hyphomicrobiales bacterium]NRB13970.1 SRPBCC domain-containing protein [Hyphomicrobiales bacterium]